MINRLNPFGTTRAKLCIRDMFCLDTVSLGAPPELTQLIPSPPPPPPPGGFQFDSTALATSVSLGGAVVSARPMGLHPNILCGNIP